MAETNPVAQSSMCSICLGEDLNLPSFPGEAPHDPTLCTRDSSRVSNPIDGRGSEDGYPWVYCPSSLRAFSLKHKDWQRIPPHDLSEVTQNDKAFKGLWTNGHVRDLDHIVAAYQKHELHNMNPDIIDGKGRGFNILLRGGPGTGKRMTVGKSYTSFPSIHVARSMYHLAASDIVTRESYREARLSPL